MRKPKQRATPFRPDTKGDDRAEALHDYNRAPGGTANFREHRTAWLWGSIITFGTMGGDCGGCGQESVQLLPNDLCKGCTDTALHEAIDKHYDDYDYTAVKLFMDTFEDVEWRKGG